jgi:hypothetical protein
MPAKKKPFRKILPPARPPTHFTVEEGRRAVLTVMVERGELSPEQAEALMHADDEESRSRQARPRSEAA